MTVAAILKAKGNAVETVSRDTSIEAVAARLHEKRIGAVLVMDGETIAGVVSERDIVRGLHSLGAGVLDRTASDCMTWPVVTIGIGMSAADALALMTDRRIRHLPVVEDGRLVGLVSIGDLVKRRIDEAEREAAALKDYIATA